jgi:hypothetical protein
MKSYNVIHHDHTTAKRINTERGYYASVNPESFRNVPITSMIWTRKVVAATKSEAIEKAKNQ